MKRHFIFLLLAAFLLSSPACAEDKAGEGYVRPTYREIMQTIIMMGGLDIKDTRVGDEYGRLIQCKDYQENYNNDAIWRKIRDEIVARVLDRKEPYRRLYENISSFRLDRYDFDTQSFPFTRNTAMKGVTAIELFSEPGFEPYCGITRRIVLFPHKIMLALDWPLTVDRLQIPADKVEKLIARMEEAGNADRKVYGRMRVLITNAPLLVQNEDGIYPEGVLHAELQSVDFFLDPAATKPLGSMQISR